MSEIEFTPTETTATEFTADPSPLPEDIKAADEVPEPVVIETSDVVPVDQVFETDEVDIEALPPMGRVLRSPQTHETTVAAPDEEDIPRIEKDDEQAAADAAVTDESAEDLILEAGTDRPLPVPSMNGAEPELGEISQPAGAVAIAQVVDVEKPERIVPVKSLAPESPVEPLEIDGSIELPDSPDSAPVITEAFIAQPENTETPKQEDTVNTSESSEAATKTERQEALVARIADELEEALETENAHEQEEPSVQDIIIETQVDENVEIKSILCTHAMENLPIIVDGLRDCDVICVETILSGADDAQQLHKSKLHTALLSDRVKKEVAIPYLQGEIDEGSLTSAITFELMGTNKQFHYIDINSSHPDYHLEEDGKKKNYEYQLKLLSYDCPLAEVKEAHMESFAAELPWRQAREQHMRGQVQQLIDEAKQRPKPVRIGVMTGMSHRAVTKDLGEEVRPGAQEEVDQKLQEGLAESLLAVQSLVEGDQLQAEHHIDRGLLGDYLYYHARWEAGPDLPEAERNAIFFTTQRMIKQLGDDQVGDLLGIIDDRLTTPVSRKERFDSIGDALRPLLHMLTRDAARRTP